MSEPKRPPGIKFVGEIPAGSSWRFVSGRLVIAGPSHAPYFLNDDGSKETLSMAPAPMNEMAERASEAAYIAARKREMGDDWFDDNQAVAWRDLDEGQKDRWRIPIRAAIAAMREPTVAMRQAGEKALDGIRGAWPEEAWRAMIDEAAKP